MTGWKTLTSTRDFSAASHGKLLRVVLVLAIGLPLLLAALVFFALDNTSMVVSQVPLSGALGVYQGLVPVALRGPCNGPARARWG